MLEPVAAVIFNTVLCGRSHLERSAPLQSVARIMRAPSQRSMTSNFFTPQPRRVKGKARVTGCIDEDSDPEFSSQCREWSFQTKHSICSLERNTPLMMKEMFTSNERPSRRYHSPRHNIALRRHPPPACSVFSGPAQISLQQRHASQMPTSISAVDPSSSSVLPSTEPAQQASQSPPLPTHAIIEEFQDFVRKPSSQLDIDRAWAIYDAVTNANAWSLLDVHPILAFSDKILSLADRRYDTATEIHVLNSWGRRLRTMLSALESRVTPLSIFDYWRTCSMSRAAAIAGDLDDALSLLHTARRMPLIYEEQARILRVYKTLVFFTYRYHNAIQVLSLLAKEWPNVGSHLKKSSGLWHLGVHGTLGASLRNAVHYIIAQWPRPASLLSRNSTEWDAENIRTIGELMIDAYCAQHLPLQALEVHAELQRQQLSIPLDAQLRLVRALVHEDALGLAKQLFSSLPSGTTYKFYLQTALHLFANDGDVRRAESYYNSLAQQKWTTELDVAMLLRTYATHGRIDTVRRRFDDFFPLQEDGTRANSPQLMHFSVAIYAHAQKGDIEGINNWLEQLSKAGFRPDVTIFTVILQAFAKRGDMASVVSVLTQMRENKIEPNIVTYINLITLLAHRRDAVGAETIYVRALEDGIVPNRRLVSAVMNAHVMAGSWKGVIRVFDYISSSPQLNIQLTIEVYNTLLKAYVLIGAPFRIVSEIFTKLEKSNIKPDTYSFALLIQSACDAGELGIASDIFHEMDKLAVDWQSHIHVDVYIMTILMAGYLRAGKRVQARAVYDEMCTRGIQPTAVTFSAILASYGNQRSEESLKIAEDFINSLMSTEERPWVIPGHGGQSALELIYGPVLRGYTLTRKPEDVERMFQQFLDAGGVPTLGTLTSLLDVYRRQSDIEAVRQIWPQIFELGLQYNKDRPLFKTGEDPSRNRLQGNILCVPLSMYVDALSAAGLHLEIAAVWKEFQTHGFFFDAHNWNHLAVALIRAGEVERAFQIVEKVILPYQRQAVNITRDSNPTDPLLFNEGKTVDIASLDSQAQLKTNTYRRHANVVRNTRRVSSIIGDEEETPKDDYAHPLHVLYQISPSWNVWKPHTALLTTLLRAVSSLRAGYLVEPIRAQEDQPLFLDYTELENPEKRQQAVDTLNKIYTEYPETCRLVIDFEQRERRRLGTGFDSKYSYA